LKRLLLELWNRQVMNTKHSRARRARDKDELIDWSKAKRVRLPNLKPSTQSISLRLPVHTLERIKVAANARAVPYQSLIKVWLEEKLSA
jgi:predicted DNA binding CopG/RHH family protein